MPSCVILCGGKGTRLREQTEHMPKPLVEVGNMPILWHIMKHYNKYGVKKFILCLGYKGEMIKDFFINKCWLKGDITYDMRREEIISGKMKGEDWEIIFAETGINNRTGSRIKQIQKYVEGEDFFLTYGDGVSDVNISRLYEKHKQRGLIGTVTAVRPKSRFGNLILDEHDVVKEFEKKFLTTHGWIDGGFFVFNKKFFDYLNTREDCMLEKEPLQQLARDGELRAEVHKSFWQCMDTQKDVDLLNELAKKEKGIWKK